MQYLRRAFAKSPNYIATGPPICVTAELFQSYLTPLHSVNKTFSDSATTRGSPDSLMLTRYARRACGADR